MEQKISQLAKFYSNARLLIQQNKISEARENILAFVKIAQKIYREQTIIMLKVKTKVLIVHWVNIAKELREKGITDEVLQAFALSKNETKNPKFKEEHKSKKTTPSLKMPPHEQGVPDFNDLIGQKSHSQGWSADLFEKYKHSVVSIQVASSRECGSGTGFVISKNGYLLTNDHVIFSDGNNAYHEKIEMSFSDCKTRHILSVIASDQKSDVALCKFDVSKMNPPVEVARIADYSKLKQGADILVIGNGFDLGVAPFTGTVKYTRDNVGNLVYTAPTNPGDSGAPVFNRIGECVGIHKSCTKAIQIGNNAPVEASGMTNATPMDKVEELLARWKKEYGIML